MRSAILAILCFLAGSLWTSSPQSSTHAQPVPTLDVPGLERPLLTNPPVSARACARLGQALRAAGWPDLLVPTMLAIARAESGCRPEARLATFREESIGPLQINIRAHRWVTPTCARDFLCASWAGLRIYRRQGLRAWTAYRTGAYRAFILAQ